MNRQERRLDVAPETATVAALTGDGEGVVRSGKTVFVAGALPGELIRFQRLRRHRQHDDGRLLEVLRPAAARVDPRCAHFGVCGGCALQHYSPDAQLESKQLELRDALERVGRVAPGEWLAPVRGPVWNYRRRARLGVKFVTKKGRVLVGFRERLAPYVADLQGCEVLARPVGTLIMPLAELLFGLTVRERVPQIEVAVADNAVALVLRNLGPLSADDEMRLREFSAAHSVRLYLQPGGLGSVRPLVEEGSAGDPLRYGLPEFDLQLAFEPTDFVQVNGPVNEALVGRAVDLLELDRSCQVLDLFCGIGNFSLALATRAGRVTGVEGEPGLVERARSNAQRNKLANVEFHVENLARLPGPDRPWLQTPYTHVLLDPPRAGASAVLSTVARLRPRKLLYISCHPGSLARDVGVLVHEHGLRLRSAGVVDMFPHTAHVESLALLEQAGTGVAP